MSTATPLSPTAAPDTPRPVAGAPDTTSVAARLTTFERHTFAGLLNRGFARSSHAARWLPVARPARHGVALEANVPWRMRIPDEPDAHLLDVYRPASYQDGAAPLPVVLYLHGGGFRGLDKDTHWVMGIGFARAGYLVFNVNYRLAPRNRFPAAAEDACAAWIWAVQHAARFGGDPSRIVVAGESAGANLAAVVGVATAWRREEPWARAAFDTGVAPCALSPACGILQVSDPLRFGRRKPIGRVTQSIIAGCFYGYIGDDEDPAADHGLADPLLVVERAGPPDRPMAPTFLAVGTRDPLLDDTRRFAAALTAHGTPVEARYYRGMEHAFHAWMVRPQAKLCWADQLRFLAPYTGVGG